MFLTHRRLIQWSTECGQLPPVRPIPREFLDREVWEDRSDILVHGNDESILQWKNEILEDFARAASPAGIPEIYQPLTAVETEAIMNLTLPQIRCIMELMRSRNAYTVAYAPVASAILRCNTAAYQLGCTSQCLGIFMYLVKYVTKDANTLGDSVALIATAIEHVQEYPTEPRPNETDAERRNKKLLQRIINSTNAGAREMPCTTVAYANCGKQEKA